MGFNVSFLNIKIFKNEMLVFKNKDCNAKRTNIKLTEEFFNTKVNCFLFYIDYSFLTDIFTI